MYRGYLNRRRDSREHTPQHTPAAPSAPSPSSIAASLPSPSGSVLSGLSNSNSTSSDISASDRYIRSTTPSTSKSRFFPVPFSSSHRSASAAHMGQGQSRTGAVPESYSPVTPPALPLPLSSNRIKRAWGRRKKSEDVTGVLSSSQHFDDKGKGRDGDLVGSVISSASTTPASSVDNLPVSYIL